MKKMNKKESSQIRGGVSCKYCNWSVSGSSCTSLRKYDLHLKAWHIPTQTVRTCS